MTLKLQNLDRFQKLTNPDGTPTEYFIRLLQRANLVADSTAEEVQGAVPSTRLINTDAPITGGGDLSADLTIGHAESGVVPDTYGDATNVPQITVDEFGHVTDVDLVPITGGGGGGGGQPFWGWSGAGIPDPGSVTATSSGASHTGSPTAGLGIAPYNAWYWSTGFTTAALVFDFGVPVTLEGIGFVQDIPASQGNWQVSASPDGITYTNLGSPDNWGSVPITEIVFTNTTAYRYYKVTQVSGSTNNAAWQQQFLFRWSGVAGGGGGGGGGEVVLASYTCVGGEPQIDLPGIPAGHGHLIVRTALQGSTGDSTRMRFNGDSSAVYDSYRMYGGVAAGNDQANSQTAFQQNIALSSNFGGTAPGFFASAEIHIPFYDNAARFKTYTVENSWSNNGGALATGFVVSGAGKWRNTAPITQITLIPVSGTFNAGSVVEVCGTR